MLLAFVFLLSGRIDISLIDCRVIPLAQCKKFELFLTFHQRMLYWIKCWLKELHLQCIGMIVLESTASLVHIVLDLSHAVWTFRECWRVTRVRSESGVNLFDSNNSTVVVIVLVPVLTFILSKSFETQKVKWYHCALCLVMKKRCDEKGCCWKSMTTLKRLKWLIES